MEKLKQITFKNRIIFIFLLNSIVPFICIGFLSFYTIDSILSNKVKDSLQSSLKQDLITLENTLNNLNHVSQQLAIGGMTTKLLQELQIEKEPFRRVQLQTDITNELNLISFSNPNVGLINVLLSRYKGV